ncbi:MAG: Gfo/Idh/MocA family oxidoreductase [Candidatus Brocadiaceae bacterium]|nr:Gfo/Idh/MocA family oxidoreductase [Candidatus Brocadiaceae bacterium]
MAFRICTIGCGGIATGRHGPSYAAYAAARPDTELAACCDLIADRAERFRDKFGFARCYTDLDRMLETERPDAVCLVSPVPVTCELSCRVMSMGYPLMMEKPPGRTPEELEQMIAAAEAAGVAQQVAFNRRYAPLNREFRRILTEEIPPEAVQHIRYEMVRVQRKDTDFSTTAIHGIDATRFLIGSDYAHVRFHYREMPELGPGVANIFMDCTFKSGATGHLSFCPVAGMTVERAQLHALDHTIVLHHPVSGSDVEGRLVHFRTREPVHDVTATKLAGTDEAFVLDGFFGENASFFDDIRAGRRPVGDLRSARQSLKIAQCMSARRDEYTAD